MKHHVLSFHREVSQVIFNKVDDGFKMAIHFRLGDAHINNGQDWRKYLLNLRVELVAQTQGNPSADLTTSAMLVPSPGTWNEIAHLGNDVLKHAVELSKMWGFLRHETYMRELNITADQIAPSQMEYFQRDFEKWRIDSIMQLFEKQIEDFISLANTLHNT